MDNQTHDTVKDILIDEIKKLPDRNRLILALRYCENERMKEIYKKFKHTLTPDEVDEILNSTVLTLLKAISNKTGGLT